MSKLEELFKKQHVNCDMLSFDEQKKNVMNKIAKERENFQNNNDWMTLDEIINFIDEVRAERNKKVLAGV